jgi:adenine-specific DNA-methyltransferase
VGKEGEDLTRHDKWLCMMYPRLKLLHRLLADDGAIFISIDDNSLAYLKLICDEIFGKNNFIEFFCWTKTSTAPSLANKSRKTVEYVVCYEKKIDNEKYEAELSDGGDAPLLNSGNPFAKIVFPKNKVFFKMDDITFKAGQYNKAFLHNDIEIKNGIADKDVILSSTFKWIQETVNKEIKLGTTFIIKSDKFSIRFQRTTKSYKAPTNLLKNKYFNTTINKIDNNVDTNEGAKKILSNIFGKNIFDYPKPPSLIKFFIKLMSNKDSTILDSFAGSGTTAHAVLNLNKEDGGNRKFILVEMEDYANTITAERVRRVIKGYGKGTKAVEGTGGDFTFYELGETMFIDKDFLNENLPLEEIRKYVYYTETGSTKTYQAQSAAVHIDYLGHHHNTDYYFHYKKGELTTLDTAFLNTITQKADGYVIYADVCGLSDDMMRTHNIVFKKIPRDITRL